MQMTQVKKSPLASREVQDCFSANTNGLVLKSLELAGLKEQKPLKSSRTPQPLMLDFFRVYGGRAWSLSFWFWRMILSRNSGPFPKINLLPGSGERA